MQSLASLPPLQRAAVMKILTENQAEAIVHSWDCHARPNQLPPPGDWRVWLLLAGRGFGKTRTGAETVRAAIEAGKKRIALVAPTAADARDVMVEGESGILWIGPADERPLYEPSKRRLTWPNGAIATTYSADEPERLRGPQHDFAWCFIAGTKILTAAGEHSIETLELGELVVTRNGLRPVVAVGVKFAPVGLVRFSNGEDLIGTADHPVLTSHGWTRLSDLAKGEQVCVARASNGADVDGTATTADITNSEAPEASATPIGGPAAIACLDRRCSLPSWPGLSGPPMITAMRECSWVPHSAAKAAPAGDDGDLSRRRRRRLLTRRWG
jgi:hypothetical protein